MSKLALNGGTPVRTAAFPERPYYDRSELAQLEEALTSRRWTSAPYVFRGDLSLSKVHTVARRFAEYHDCAYGLAVGSGTDALQLAYAAAGLGPGDEVIMPGNIFIAGATPALNLGAVPVFVDVDPETLCVDPDAMEAAITPRTRLLVPLHMGGYPADMDRVMEIAAKHNLRVVADSCHAPGTEWRGRKVASWADLSCFSFQQDKAMTGGEGGAVTTNDEELYNQCYMLNNDGRGLGDQAGQFVVQGWNLRMSEFQAAVLTAQMDRLPEFVRRKNRNADILAAGFAEIGGIGWPRPDSRIGMQALVYPRLRYHSEAFEGLAADAFAAALRAEGIPCGAGGGWLLYRHPLFLESSTRFRFETSKRIDYSQVHCPNAESAAGRWLSLPQEVLWADEAAMADIVEAVAKVKAHRGEIA